MTEQEIIADQKALAQMMERFITNFKKDGPGRKTSIYLTNKRAELCRVWEDFNMKHQQLLLLLSRDHAYFTEDLYGKTNELYNDAQGMLNQFEGVPTSPLIQQFSDGQRSSVIPTISQTELTPQSSGFKAANVITTVQSTPIQIPTTTQQPSAWPVTYTTAQQLPQASHQPIYTGSTASIDSTNLHKLPHSMQQPQQQYPYVAQNLPKLPPIRIPRFTGEVKEWKTFIEIFTHVIDANPILSSVEKMQYLLSFLEGDARKIISHLDLNSTNYNAALKLIKARYDDRRKIITTYINTILELKKVEHRSAQDIISLHDTTNQCLEALNSLGYETTHWDAIIVCIVLKKMDNESLRYFEGHITESRAMPKLSEIMEFLLRRYQTLEAVGKLTQKVMPKIFNSNNRKTFHTTLKVICVVCGKDHNITKCEEFKNLSTTDRYKLVTQKNLCTNCLSHNKEQRCNSRYTCYYCKKRHHSLLHENRNKASFSGQSQYVKAPTETTNGPVDADTSCYQAKAIRTHTSKILLATAMVKIQNTAGNIQYYRALIDPGSEASFITEEAVQHLRLPKQRIRALINGVGESKAAVAQAKVNIQLQPRYASNLCISIEAFVLPKLTSLLPEVPITNIDLAQFNNIMLADPTFDTPGPIDIILGAGVYSNIILEGLKHGEPTAQNTKLGWILLGKVSNIHQSSARITSLVSLAEIEEKIKKFWELEEETEKLPTKKEQESCEEHFITTHERDSSGRYIVHLPFSSEKSELGESKKKAVARLIQIEKKISKNPETFIQYNEFLMEYLKLGHMSPKPPYTGEVGKVYYLPHHAVFKEDSTTTKLRVVFDGSCKTHSGKSLNDILQTGSKLQQDLHKIIIRWRKYRYVYTADIEKMFRQIQVAEEDKNFQRILWRSSPNQPINEFVLNTVTYGTASATYLAVRALMQLAEDEGEHYPIAKRALIKDFYIDDLMTGAHTKDEAIKLQQELITILKRGGFNLRKWTSNNEELLNQIPADIREKGICEIVQDNTVKTLGIHWNPRDDEFQFKLRVEPASQLTKRVLLAKIASIFDPLGWLAPITMKAKLLMQALWSCNTAWDDQPPSDIKEKWLKFEAELHHINTIKIPRWINYRSGNEIQLHGFCDASEKGYAAVIYARAADSFNHIKTTIVAAKTKVAPLKQKTTLPRLELCGALLLAQLFKTTTEALEINNPELFAWCDSEITLAWINKDSTNWKTFIANRVAEIHQLTKRNIWRHITSEANPADVASRGIDPHKLALHPLWWSGPSWLKHSTEHWPTNKLIIESTSIDDTIITKFSNYNRLVRITALCKRFFENCKVQKQNRKTGHLLTQEIQNARNIIIKIIQHQEFSQEIIALRNKKNIHNSSKLLSLHPYLDTEGILRVGGRLENGNLPIDMKHPILLPQKNHFTNLIIDRAHQRTLHGGVQLTCSYVRSEFWIINSSNTIKSRLHKCIRCARFRNLSSKQLMGNLPIARITPASPFSNTGIDFAGPFLTKASKGRGTKTLKGYIALFVCMVTKAIHLELVSDLSTDAFLAALKRFISRRGNCKQIYSDNATNFVGAHNKMQKEIKDAIREATISAAELLANDGTEWKFIPPATPHFGGIWEAGVKAVKTHLKKILGETLLTFEEFTTVIYQIEACLNSRPICQMSSDPTDMESLTPGHFLIGKAPVAMPEPDVTDKHPHQRWKLVTKLHQDFWKRWSQEYLSTLQQRTKWKTQNTNTNIGQLVLIKEDNMPPQKWALGRIEQVHPGDDGLVRVVSVKTKTGIKKRPIQKLCSLPVPNETSDNEVNSSTIVKTNHIKVKEDTTKIVNLKRKTPPKSTAAISTDKLAIKTSTRKKIKIAPCTWAMKLVFIFYLFSLAFGTSNMTYKIIEPKPGLYIESLGHTQIKRGNLRLEIQFPMTMTTKDQQDINATWISFQELCDKTKNLFDTTHCGNLLQHVKAKRDELFWFTEEIQQFYKSSVTKRGLVGSVLTYVFGVNDEVYTQINELKHDHHAVLETVNQQTLMLHARVTQSNAIIEDKLKHFDDRLSHIIATINEMNRWYIATDYNKISIRVLATYLTAVDYYDELLVKYKKLVQALHNYGSILDFISIQNIDEIISNTTIKLGSNLKILRTPQQFMNFEYVEEKLKLFGYLHIIEANKYELVHVTPIPHQLHDHIYSIPEIITSTLAVNYNEQTYFFLQEEELKECILLEVNHYLCSPTTVFSIEQKPLCIIDEMYNRHAQTPCTTVQAKITGVLWKKLLMRNTWLYIADVATPAAIICKSMREDIVLNNTGIIKTNSNCYIKTLTTTLRATVDEQLRVIKSFNKAIPPSISTTIAVRSLTEIKNEPIVSPHESLFPPPPVLPVSSNSIVNEIGSHSISVVCSIFGSLLLFLVARRSQKYFKHRKLVRAEIHSPTDLEQQFDKVLSITSKSVAPREHVQSTTEQLA